MKRQYQNRGNNNGGYQRKNVNDRFSNYQNYRADYNQPYSQQGYTQQGYNQYPKHNQRYNQQRYNQGYNPGYDQYNHHAYNQNIQYNQRNQEYNQFDNSNSSSYNHVYNTNNDNRNTHTDDTHSYRNSNVNHLSTGRLNPPFEPDVPETPKFLKPESNLDTRSKETVNLGVEDEFKQNTKEELELIAAGFMPVESSTPQIDKMKSNEPAFDHILSRKNKIKEWKNNRIEKTSKKSLMKFSKKKSSKLNNKLTRDISQSSKDIVFDDDENEEKIQRKVPSLANIVDDKSDMEVDTDKPQSDDDLDDFLNTLQHQEIKQTNISKLIKEEEELENDDSISDSYDEDNDKILRLLNKKNQKEVPIPEFPDVTFNKEFYKECDLIKGMPDSQIKQFRNDNSIAIKGNNQLKPIFQWNQLGLPTDIFDILDKFKFKSPTLIQCESLPNIMNGKDFIGIAETGSGKTIAFLLPLFRQLLSNPKSPVSNSGGSLPRSIILTPTRELAIQISKVAKPFTDPLGLKIVKCFGGQSISKQIGDLKKARVDILIGTPGRIIDLLTVNSGKVVNLSYVSYLVIDEADRMFDMGFEPQIFQILKALNPNKQTVLFSATFPPKIEKMVIKILRKDFIEVKIGNKNIINKNIKQNFEFVKDEDEKFNKLLNILGNRYSTDTKNKILIFVETQNKCDEMVKKLLKRGYPVMSIHGGKEQVERDGTIKEFKNGIIDIIIATSIASRGLDVEDLKLVINYDAPSHLEDYIHRVGRTGRGGLEGESITLLTTKDEKCCFDLRKVLQENKLPVNSEMDEIANAFEEKMKTGDVKFGSGFSGKGLEKLNAIREKNEKEEKELYLKENDGNRNEPHKTETVKDKDEKTFKVIYDEEGASIDINDLPQSVRWYVTSAENSARLSTLTGTVATTRGTWVSGGDSSTNVGKDRLSIRLEGDASSVELAVKTMTEWILRGLQRENEGI